MTYTLLVAKLYTMAYRYNIKKQHWERYQIVQTKLYQHWYYKMDETSKYKIKKYKMDKYGHLANFRKSCKCHNRGNQLILGI